MSTKSYKENDSESASLNFVEAGDKKSGWPCNVQ